MVKIEIFYYVFYIDTLMRLNIVYYSVKINWVFATVYNINKYLYVVIGKPKIKSYLSLLNGL